MEPVVFPTLYKKTNTGAIQYWKIQADTTNQGFTFDLGWVRTEYGQLGTDSPQITDDVIKEGKNTGKKNATTPVQQAIAEAKAKWEKQKKKGYVESIEAAQNEELDELIEGGEEPMLAESYVDVIYNMRPGHENDPPELILTKESKKIKFPAYVQPKLDGIRGVSIAKIDRRDTWSRTRKRFGSVPHINEELNKLFGAIVTVNSDGELYNHEFKSDFEEIVSIIRKEEPEDGYLNIQYHMYDAQMNGDFATRIEFLANLVSTYEKVHGALKYIRLVPTSIVNNQEELIAALNHYTDLGYEGAMVRNADSPYQYRRTTDLQKLKKFMEDDFEIVGIKEGRGKLSGHVGAFVLKLKTANTTKEGTVDVKLKGKTEYLKTCFEDHSQWKGKKLTVVFQGFTVEKSLRFPVGKAIRDYE